MFAKGHKSEMFPNDHKMFTKDIAPRSGLTENVRKRIQIRNVHKRSQNVHKRISLPDLDSLKMFAKGHKSEMFPNDHKMFTKGYRSQIWTH